MAAQKDLTKASAHEQWVDIQVGRKLLADHIRNGACRGLYSYIIADRMIALIPQLEEQIKQETQDALHLQS